MRLGRPSKTPPLQCPHLLLLTLHHIITLADLALYALCVWSSPSGNASMQPAWMDDTALFLDIATMSRPPHAMRASHTTPLQQPNDRASSTAVFDCFDRG